MISRKNFLSILLMIFFSSNVLYAQNKLSDSFFNDAEVFFNKYIEDNSVKYKELKEGSGDLQNMMTQVREIDLTDATDLEKKAFYINAYNLSVISLAINEYPLTSVNDVNGFFDSKKITVAGEKMTLNSLEKDKLLKVTNDARLHFVLVCGAVSCPPIINKAYKPETLDAQMTEQTEKALNNSEFIKVDVVNKKVELSQIFNWYASDFGKSKENVLTFINKYREQPIAADSKVSYYNYDWSLNEYKITTDTLGEPGLSNNAIRYVVSSTIPKGSSELKVFNNLYSQNIDGTRGNFFNTTFSYLYGLNRRVNIGLAARYARVSTESADNSPFKVLGANRELNSSQFRHGLTFVGPQVRWAPVEKWGNFSIQSQFLIPTGKDNEGINGAGTYLDWGKPRWLTQFFNDKSIGGNFSLFTEADISFEDLGRKSEGAFNQLTIPLTGILSYFPHPKLTLYGLANFSPQLTNAFSNERQSTFFYQGGTGVKYQFNRKLELELLYTAFRSQGLLENNGVANTFNMGVRASF